VRSRSDLRNSPKERIGFVLFAMFIGSVLWLTHSSAFKLAQSMDTEAASVAAKAPQKDQGTNVGQSQSPQNTCPQCDPPGNQVIYAPLIELPETSGTEINLNCRSSHVMDVAPTFYTQRGEAVVGDVFQMQPAEVRTVDLKSLIPLSVRNRHDWGGMTLSFAGGHA